MIVFVGVIVLATLRFGGLGIVRPDKDVPNARVGGIGLMAGFASGISGAGWGPIGVKLLILTRINPKQAIGSSLFARIFMAASAVVGVRHLSHRVPERARRIGGCSCRCSPARSRR